MKTLTVTGLSNEQDFLMGQSFFILILNKEIRIPISEEIASRIIKELYEEESSIPEMTSSPIISNEDEDGIDQI